MLTTRRLYSWHRELNARVFDGALSRCKLEVGDCGEDAIGLCWGNRIRIAEQPLADAKATLLHEMIHQWQHLHGLPMDHGPVFEVWRKLCLYCTKLSP